MIVATTPEELKDSLNGSCVTIGNFDGVHKGHQKLIRMTCDKAAANDLTSVVMTFDPHPLRVLVGPTTPPFITLTEQKLELISQYGPHAAVVMNFTRELAALTPEEFVVKHLVEGLKMREMVIGYDYHLGKGRQGDYETLCKLGEKYGFNVERVEPVTIGDAIVSSTRIRDMVQSGDVWDVMPLLGRFFQVKGEVIHGMKRGGKLLGFPTANLDLADELFPKTGVYAVWVEVQGEVKQGVANIGKNPTFGNDAVSVEVHILDFDEDLYGEHLRVHFVQRVRSERKFNGIDELKERIALDCELGRKILAQPEANIRLTRPQFTKK